RVEERRLLGAILLLDLPARRPAVLADRLARLERQVEPREARVSLLEKLHHAEALAVVLEAPVGFHALVERVLPRVAEGRVTEVVAQRDDLAEVLIQPDRAGDRAGDLRGLRRVGEPRPVVVALVVDEDLGLVGEAPERRRVNDAGAVALKGG